MQLPTRSPSGTPDSKQIALATTCQSSTRLPNAKPQQLTTTNNSPTSPITPINLHDPTNLYNSSPPTLRLSASTTVKLRKTRKDRSRNTEMASSDPKAPAAQKTEEPKVEEKKPAAIGEDDEFEDFPAEGRSPPSLTLPIAPPLLPFPRPSTHHHLGPSPPSARITPIPSIMTPAEPSNPRKAVRTDEK